MKSLNTMNNDNKHNIIYQNLCRQKFIPIHGNNINKLIKLSSLDFENLLNIYIKTDCLNRWNKIKKYVLTMHFENNSYDIAFISSFYTTSIQHYIDFLKEK
jgi:hypothetical protein